MLIIAIPKSASTSIMQTMGYVHNLKSIQDFSFNTNPYPNDINVIHALHSDIRELNKTVIEKFNKKDIFYKQHIYPSKNNIHLLKDIKKVILLREPKDILEAYVRDSKKKHKVFLRNYNVNKTKTKCLIKYLIEEGLLEDLINFKNKWENNKDANTLVIHYSDYIRNTNKVVNEIESFYGLSLTNYNVKPVKARYSRGKTFNENIFKFTITILEFLKNKKYRKEIL